MTGQFDQQYQLLSTVMISTSLPGPCNLQCEQHSVIMFISSMTGPSTNNIVNSGQRSCSVHGPSCQNSQQHSTVRFSFWSKLPSRQHSQHRSMVVFSSWSKLPTFSTGVTVVFSSWSKLPKFSASVNSQVQSITDRSKLQTMPVAVNCHGHCITDWSPCYKHCQ